MYVKINFHSQKWRILNETEWRHFTSGSVLALPHHWPIQGGARNACTLLRPISFIFMQFLKKIDQNNRLVPPPLWLASFPLGNSWSDTAHTDDNTFCFYFELATGTEKKLPSQPPSFLWKFLRLNSKPSIHFFIEASWQTTHNFPHLFCIILTTLSDFRGLLFSRWQTGTCIWNHNL